MIGGEGVETGLYVGEVVPEKNSHIDIKASAIRDGRIGMRARPRGLPILSPRRLHEPAHGEAVSDIPGDAWQLCCPIGDARGDTGGRIGHTSFPVPTRDRIVYGAPIFPEQLCIAHIELRAREAQLLARLPVCSSGSVSPGSRGAPSGAGGALRRALRCAAVLGYAVSALATSVARTTQRSHVYLHFRADPHACANAMCISGASPSLAEPFQIERTARDRERVVLQCSPRRCDQV
jgi:hypothetical protein